MEKEAKDLLQKIISELGKVRYALSNAPRKQDETGVGPQNAAKNKDDSAGGKLLTSPKICPTPRDSDKTEQPWYKTMEGWKTTLEIVAIPFAIGYAIVTFLQWRDVKHNFVVGERAWIAPFDVSSEPFENDATKTIFKVLFKNTGKSPATKVYAFINRVSHISQIPTSDKSEINSGMILAPDGVGNTATTDTPITALDVENIKGRKVMVYIYGTIWYTDIFTKPHWTQFCYYAATNLRAFGPCPIHNDCDDCGTTKQQDGQNKDTNHSP